MISAAFSLDNYNFKKIQIDFNKKENNDINLGFKPSGKFLADDSLFILSLTFIANSDNTKDPFILIENETTFKFENKISKEDIPAYFYTNSIAIIFPYIRAFISTVTLQTNIHPPIVLPTLNLSNLEETLRNNTVFQ